MVVWDGLDGIVWSCRALRDESLVDGWTSFWMHYLLSRRTLTFCSSRLYQKGRILGHKRGKRNSKPNTSLLKLEGVTNKEDAQFYLGKVWSCGGLCLKIFLNNFKQRVAYVYRAKREVRGSKVRVIWGYVYLYCTSFIKLSSLLFRRISRPHGNSGVVKSKFRSNLPPHSFGASVRVVSIVTT